MAVIMMSFCNVPWAKSLTRTIPANVQPEDCCLMRVVKVRNGRNEEKTRFEIHKKRKYFHEKICIGGMCVKNFGYRHRLLSW